MCTPWRCVLLSPLTIGELRTELGMRQAPAQAHVASANPIPGLKIRAKSAKHVESWCMTPMVGSFPSASYLDSVLCLPLVGPAEGQHSPFPPPGCPAYVLPVLSSMSSCTTHCQAPGPFCSQFLGAVK